MKKTERFINAVMTSVKETTRATIKKDSRNSTKNNRVVTINQVANHLGQQGSFRLMDLSDELLAVKDYMIENKLLSKVRKNNNRTDAYDINELAKAFSKYVVNNKKHNNSVSRIVSNY